MTDSEIIDKLGGSTKVACICDIAPQAVSQWRRDGIPDARRQYLADKYPDVVTYERKYRCTISPAPTIEKRPRK